MKKKLLSVFSIFALLLCFAQCSWGDVAINATNFPDPNFRTFVSENCDVSPHDGKLTDSEILATAEIDVCNKNISSLKGVEYFTSLISLDCSENALTKLDVSQNTELTTLGCHINQLTELDVRNNVKLSMLLCYLNQLTELDVSKNKSLSTLSCSSNQLTNIDVSNNVNLEIFECAVNNLTKLDVSSNTKLYMLHCDFNRLSVLDLGNNKLLGQGGADLGVKLLAVNNQIVPELKIIKQSDTSYPYAVDFSKYMTQKQLNNIVASSVRGIDEDRAEIKTAYENGIAKFQLLPTTVEYNYMTGFNELSMDVKIGTPNYFIVSLNNHVYRLFPRLMTWANAQAFCESIGGHLITVNGNSDEEKKLVEEFLKFTPDLDKELGAMLWTGGEFKNNSWSWITGEEFNGNVEYSLDYGGNGNYLLLMKTLTGDDSFFVSASNSVFASFICEWEPVQVDMPDLNPDYIVWSNDQDGYASGDNYGVIPNPVDFSHLADNPPAKTWTSTPPTAYDPRTAGRTLPPARSQGDYGTCWSFGSIGALEASYIAQFGYPAPDLSELHQAWFVFKDPRTKNRFYNKNDKMTTNEILHNGGYSLASIAFLSRAGTARESDLPYTSITGTPSLISLTKGKYPENYSHPIRLKDAYFINVLSAANKNDVKQFVLKNGAVAAAFYWNKSCYSSSTYSYFMSSAKKSTNHIIQIVGWDDNYSRMNFNSNHRPKSNGAWLIKNSWGSSWGDNAYGWISYEEFIDDIVVYVADRKTGGTIYGHDCLDSKTVLEYNWALCMFQAQNNEAIREVAFHTRDNNMSYEIYVTRHGAEVPENPGVLNAINTRGTADYAGYHTVALNNPLKVNEGDYFSVTVHLKCNEAAKSNYRYVSAASNNGSENVSKITTAGQSYFAYSASTPKISDWKDSKTIKGGSYNACIKAFTVTGEVIDVTDSTPNPYNPDNPDNPNNNNSGSGGGGCNAGLGIFGFLILATILKLKK